MPSWLGRWLQHPGRLLRNHLGAPANLFVDELPQQVACAIVTTANEGIWLCDAQGITSFVNPCMATMLGYRIHEMTHRPVFDFMFPVDVATAQEGLAQCQQGVRLRTDFRFRGKDGSELWVHMSSNGIWRGDGQYLGTLSMMTDITERRRMEEALRQREAQLRLVFEQLPALIATTDTELRYTSWQGEWLTSEGLSEPQLLGRSVPEVAAAAGCPDHPVVAASRRALSGHSSSFVAKSWGKTFQHHVCPLRSAQGQIMGTLGIAFDITNLRRSEQALQREREQAQVTLESIADGVLTTDATDRVTYLNPAAEGITGWPRSEALGHSVDEILRLIDEASEQRICSSWRDAREDHTVALPAEFPLLRRDDVRLPIEGSISPLRDASGRFLGSVIVLRDVSATRALATQLTHQATHDALTGLPNRALLLDRLEQAIAHAERHKSRLALLYLDLDRFKHINDTLGHTTGDELLKQVSHRLEASVRRSDTVSRQGGDEFIVLLADIAQPEHLTEMAEQLVNQVAAPYYFDSHELHVSTSIGISVYPEDGGNALTLIKHADIAMYHAKARGRSNFQFFDPCMNQRAAERLFLENHLRQALEREELELHYQPQIDLRSGRIIGAEALLRWRHSKQGLIPPSRFIPVAEDSGLILPLGEWVLQQACHQAKAWEAAGLPVRVSVNVSAAQFQRKTIIDSVKFALERTGMAPERLQLELTETVVMSELSQAIEQFRQLKALGVRLSIDDFGTGYSSLSYLKQLPVNDLKIDQSFVRDISTDVNDAAIVQAIIRMGHSLKLEIVAEGVETQEAAEFLARNHCDSVQGHYFSQPLAAEAFQRLLADRPH
jgi:diguanylate cyclase (GGDEF)-like protein/PAS domain S-box-containing protein